MKAANLPAGSQRNSEVGLVWEEVITNAAGTFKVITQQTFRVSAIAATTVTVDGKLAMTMQAGEVAIFCAGSGEKNTLTKIEIIIAGTAHVQTAKEIETGRRTR